MKEPGHFFIKKKINVQTGKENRRKKKTGYRDIILRVLVQVLREAAPGWE